MLTTAVWYFLWSYYQLILYSFVEFSGGQMDHLTDFSVDRTNHSVDFSYCQHMDSFVDFYECHMDHTDGEYYHIFFDKIVGYLEEKIHISNKAGGYVFTQL